MNIATQMLLTMSESFGVGGYKYKRVKIDSKYAKTLQNKGYRIVDTEGFNGFVVFEIPVK